MLDELFIKTEDKVKTNFYASDYGKPAFELYFGLKGVEKTNPAKWYDMLKWGAGSGAETYMVKALQSAGYVDENYDQDYDGRIEFEVEGIKVSGYIDGLMMESKGGYPVEIKTINNANAWDIMKYQNDNPRENYVGQLATYMWAKNKDKGYLFVCSIDGLHRFWFECVRTAPGEYKCGNTVVNLNNEFKRWSNIWKVVQTTDELPISYLNEYKYKIPVEEIVWENVSASDISKARNGKKVIGDYQVSYSDWKDLLIKLQGSTLGYDARELEIIKNKTSGYTTWKKK